ncbi:hypothetical protein B0H14DRAFT_3134407 [Mycena olivaceomarginata]|nr:hypothetical protein B0H14DRAFT_3134407 [Mycena olivaceomarginata]
MNLNSEQNSTVPIERDPRSAKYLQRRELKSLTYIGLRNKERNARITHELSFPPAPPPSPPPPTHPRPEFRFSTLTGRVQHDDVRRMRLPESPDFTFTRLTLRVVRVPRQVNLYWYNPRSDSRIAPDRSRAADHRCRALDGEDCQGDTSFPNSRIAPLHGPSYLEQRVHYAAHACASESSRRVQMRADPFLHLRALRCRLAPCKRWYMHRAGYIPQRRGIVRGRVRSAVNIL